MSSKRKQVAVKKYFTKNTQPGGTPFLTVDNGDIVTVLKESSTGWVMCMKDDQKGYVPALCLDLANPIEPAAPALEQSYPMPTSEPKKKKKLPADAKYAKVNRAFSKESPPEGTPFLTIQSGDMVYIIKKAENGWCLACPVDDISVKGYVPAMCVDILGPASEYQNFKSPSSPEPAYHQPESEVKNEPSPVRQAQPVVAEPVVHVASPVRQQESPRSRNTAATSSNDDSNDTDRIVRLIRLELGENGLRYECEFAGPKGTYIGWKPATFFTVQASSALAAYADFTAKHVQMGALR